MVRIGKRCAQTGQERKIARYLIWLIFQYICHEVATQPAEFKANFKGDWIYQYEKTEELNSSMLPFATRCGNIFFLSDCLVAVL